jgi:hypothetical protein
LNKRVIWRNAFQHSNSADPYPIISLSCIICNNAPQVDHTIYDRQSIVSMAKAFGIPPVVIWGSLGVMQVSGEGLAITHPAKHRAQPERDYKAVSFQFYEPQPISFTLNGG